MIEDDDETTPCCDICGGIHPSGEHEPWGVDDPGQQ